MGEALAVIEVTGRPATFATAHEAPWKQAIREAVAASGLEPRPDACFKVRIDFRTPVPRTVNDRWDLDNLIKPTLARIVHEACGWGRVRMPVGFVVV